MKAQTKPQADQSPDGRVKHGVYQLAAIALNTANGDTERAARIFRTQVENNPVLLQELLAPFLDQAIYQAIRNVQGSRRQQYWPRQTIPANVINIRDAQPDGTLMVISDAGTTVVPDTQALVSAKGGKPRKHSRFVRQDPSVATLQGLRALATHNRLSLLDYRLPSSDIRLGDALLPDVLAAAKRNGILARGNAARARWLLLIVERLQATPEKTVGEAMQDSDLEQMQKQALEEANRIGEMVLPAEAPALEAIEIVDADEDSSR